MRYLLSYPRDDVIHKSPRMCDLILKNYDKSVVGYIALKTLKTRVASFSTFHLFVYYLIIDPNSKEPPQTLP